MEANVKKYFDKDYPIELSKDDSQYVGSIDDIYEKAFLRGKNLGFTHGYICCVVALINLNGEVDTRTRELYSSGVGKITLIELKKIGIDKYDLSVIKKYWSELH